MQIATDTVVSFHYQLADAQGQVIDTSAGGDPMAYLHGRGQLVPGLETALEGKSGGEHIEVVVNPAEGYGEHNKDLMIRVPMAAFPEENHSQLKPGVQFQGPRTDGAEGELVYRVVEVKDDEVFADGNHPLAGIDLHFTIDLVEVRAASEEELEHGHAHGAGGHQH